MLTNLAVYYLHRLLLEALVPLPDPGFAVFTSVHFLNCRLNTAVRHLHAYRIRSVTTITIIVQYTARVRGFFESMLQ